MDILKVSTDWAKAEVFSARIVLLLGLLMVLVALGFWQLGKSAMAKDFVWPMLVAGVLLFAVSAGLYFANQPRIARFEAAYAAGAKSFVQAEIERTGKSQNDFVVVFRVLPLIVIAGALLIMFTSAPLWRSIGVTVIALMTILMLVDSNTNARNTVYHQHLLAERG